MTAGATAPPLQHQCREPDGSAPDLTSYSSVRARVQPADRSRSVSTSAAEVLDARGGFVQHSLTAAETRYPGLQVVDFVGVDAAGKVHVWPAGGQVLEVLVARAPGG